METEVYYHYEFWELRYIRIWNKIFLSKGTVLDIINEFDFKLRFEGHCTLIIKLWTKI